MAQPRVMENFNADESNLFPVLPSTIRDSRCQAAARVRGSSTVVPLGGANLVSVPSFQFQGWTISAHPEGNPYAHIKVPVGITMVTEARIAGPGVADQLNAWLSLICNMITEKHVHFPETSHLFLEIHKDSGSCNYYFADHTLRTVFWLHTLDTVGVRSQHSFTNSHLRYALEENYWIHVEMFPEAASQYSAQALNELQVVFSHARADAPTSDTSTFPYTAKQREEIADTLERNKDRTHSSYVITYVARLWTIVASHRLNHFSEDHCRLSFGQSTSEIKDSKWDLFLAIISNTLLFGFPDGHQARFKNLWLDQLVNTSRWREHVSETVEDLKQMVSSMLALLIVNVHMMPLSSFPAFSSSSLLLCLLGLVTALYLMQEQRKLLSTNATATAVCLDNPNTSYRFQPIAIVHSLPQAMFTWALLLFAMQSFWMIFADFPLPMLLATFLPVATMLVVPCGGIWKALHPHPKTFEGATQPVPIPSLIPAVDQTEHITDKAKI
ncbi:hypothetical protein BJY52DRAFT_1416383 [Lactarius psammicola]|nr:hypothetical protein BJY52DRAFT_1416383 [Lactarius psammicola]